MPQGMIGTMISQLREAVRGAVERRVVVMPHLDLLTTRQGGLTAEARGVNEWLSAREEQKAFKMDPRFEVNLFASEEQFPEIANPIQMRWATQSGTPRASKSQ